MALTITQAGSNSSITTSTTLVTSNVNAAIGDWLLVFVASDNSGSNGIASLSTVTDSVSNSYTSTITNQDPGVSNAGATLGIFYTEVKTAMSNASVTANFTVNTPAKAMIIYKVSPGTLENVMMRTIGAGATGSSSPTITASNVNRDYTVFGGLANEGYSFSTSLTDSTGGTWSTKYSSIANTSNTTATSMLVFSQYKTVTSLNNIVFNPTVSGDSAINYIILYPSSGFWNINGVVC